MNYKSVALIVVLLSIIVALGLVVSKQGGLTGAVTAKTVACSVNSDCDDKIAGTDDVCKNPGTVDSLCFNKPK